MCRSFDGSSTWSPNVARRSFVRWTIGTAALVSTNLLPTVAGGQDAARPITLGVGAGAGRGSGGAYYRRGGLTLEGDLAVRWPRVGGRPVAGVHLLAQGSPQGADDCAPVPGKGCPIPYPIVYALAATFGWEVSVQRTTLRGVLGPARVWIDDGRVEPGMVLRLELTARPSAIVSPSGSLRGLWTNDGQHVLRIWAVAVGLRVNAGPLRSPRRDGSPSQ